jgi:hypothetical protein
VPATLDGSGNVATWTMGVDYYSYDALKRLTRVDELPAASWVGGALPHAYSQRYLYDQYGNRTLDMGGLGGSGSTAKPASWPPQSMTIGWAYRLGKREE